jgi:hypothetical protein
MCTKSLPVLPLFVRNINHSAGVMPMERVCENTVEYSEESTSPSNYPLSIFVVQGNNVAYLPSSHFSIMGRVTAPVCMRRMMPSLSMKKVVGIGSTW